MAQTNNQQTVKATSAKIYVIAWFFGLLFYFLDYAVRSAPAVMIPELSKAFAVSSVGLTSVLGTYYYTYSATSLIAGVSLDRFGAKYSLFVGTLILAIGCFFFVISSHTAGVLGRLLQGAGCAFAFPGCVYLASKGFSQQSLATAIGFTQCFGMLGGSAGQFVVGPLLTRGLTTQSFWIGAGIITAAVAVSLFFLIPKSGVEQSAIGQQRTGILTPYKIVFSNQQSWLCGIVSGLLFAPTTIFAMTWGVAFFQTDRAFDFHAATMASALIPLGWVFGCPLLGFVADKIGRRKPVIISGALLMILVILQVLFARTLMPTYISNFIFGVASGSAMIPYSVIKESNPNWVKGSATGAMNFITFGVTTIVGPIFSRLYGKTLATSPNKELHFDRSGLFWIGGIALAILITFFLKETGHRKNYITVRK